MALTYYLEAKHDKQVMETPTPQGGRTLVSDNN